MILEVKKSKSNYGGYFCICSCDTCGKIFNRKKGEFRRKKIAMTFCSKDCFYNWYKGKNRYNWNNGKTKDVHGYILARVENRYIKEHRLVMEQFLNRKLEDTEIVHHINGITDDNRIENLELFANQGEHTRYHNLSKMSI